MAGIITRKKQLRINGPRYREKGGARGRIGYVSYCPECPPVNGNVDPELNPHVSVSEKQHRASCFRGHVWDVR
jgi:hypothetical protein